MPDSARSSESTEFTETNPGITVIFIEHDVELAQRMAHRACILESGRPIFERPSADLLVSVDVRRIFLVH